MLPPQLGGKKLNVLKIFYVKSCRCGTHSNAKVFILEDDYMVVECRKGEGGYIWMKKPPDLDSFKRAMC
jgi:hypothetical protein